MIGYYKIFEDGNKTMSCRCDDKNRQKKYEKTWKNIGSIINKKFTKGSTYELSDNTYTKSKIRTFGDMIKTYFPNKKIPKEKTSYNVCL